MSVSKELEYHQTVLSHPSYQFSQVIQQTGGQTITITTSGGQESIFELSPRVFNLAKSILSFTAAPVAAGANNFNWIHTDGLPYIRQIQLYSRTGLFLCDISELANYVNMTLRRETKLEDLITYDKIGNNTGEFEGLSPCNAAGTAVPRPTINAVGDAFTNYFEPAYCLPGTVNTADPIVNVQIPLSRIKDAILSLDKNHFYNEIVYLRIVWNPSTKIYWIGTSGTNPTTGATAATGNVSVSNLVLYLAVEQNPVIEEALRARVSSQEGLPVLIPYVYSNKINLGSTTQNLSLRYNRAHGLKLRKILWAIYNNTESSNTGYDHDCTAGTTKLVNFYTSINNVRRQQFNVDLTKLQDWMLQKQRLKGSCIFSSNEHQYNFVWEENFGDDYSYTEKPLYPIPESNLIEGLSLDNEIKWDVFATTTNNNFNHYVYAVCLRQLIVNSAGISLM